MAYSDWQTPHAQAELAKMVRMRVWIDEGRCWAWEQCGLPVQREGWPPGWGPSAATLQNIYANIMPTAKPAPGAPELPVEPIDPFLQAFREKVGV